MRQQTAAYTWRYERLTVSAFQTAIGTQLSVYQHSIVECVYWRTSMPYSIFKVEEGVSEVPERRARAREKQDLYATSYPCYPVVHHSPHRSDMMKKKL